MKAVAAHRPRVKSVLVIDVGGTSVKILATGQTESRSFRSGPKLTPRQMVSKVKKLAADWTYDVISIGYPGPVLAGRPAAEPANLGRGWVAFDFAQAFGRPAKVLNDAALQALGSYKGGKMLFLRPRNGTWQRLGRQRRSMADGARPFAVQEWHIRGLRRTDRPGTRRQEDVASSCGRRRRAAQSGPAAG